MTFHQMDIDYDQVFGSDAGENEDPDALRDYFVDLPEFKCFYDAKNPLQIVQGRIGMGKSALLKRLAMNLKDVEDSSDVTIEATGNELMGMGDFSGTNQAYLEIHWVFAKCILPYLQRKNSPCMKSWNTIIHYDDIVQQVFVAHRRLPLAAHM